MIRLKLLRAAGLLVVAGFAIRASAADSARVVVGPPAARVAAYLSRAAQFGFSGSVLVAESSGVLLNEGYGWANEALRVPNTAGTIFDIGSITKTFTTNAILKLASEGLLGVHDSLPRFFPDVPPDKRDITLQHLMSHTSGIVDPPIGDYDPVTLDSLRKVVFASPLVSPAGTRYDYSNAGVTLLAMVIARVTGTDYESFLRKRLLLPSGLRQTGYNLPDWDTARIAHTYTPPVDHGTPLARLRASQGPRAMLLANGGMLSTTHDLYLWELALRGGGAVPDDAIARQFAVQFERSPRLGVGYDWEIERDSAGRPVSFSHGSDAPSVGLNGEFHRYLPERAVIIMLANTRLNGASTRHFVVPNVRKLLRDALEPLTSQEVAGVGVLDRERITVAPSAELELTLEVDRPDHIGAGDRGLWPTRVSPDLRASPSAHAAMAHQDPVNRRGRGHLGRGVGLEEELVELASAPAPMFAELEDLADQHGSGRVRALLRAMRAIGQTVGAEPGVAVEPLVAGLAADAIAPTELGEGGGGVLGIEHETLALVHG